MRYSRFKKQMDGTAGVRKPRNPNSPRKTKVEKNSKSSKKERVQQPKTSDDAGKIKEEVGVAGSSHHTPVEGTPEASTPADMDGSSVYGSVESSPFVKREPGSSGGSRYASVTPFEESTSLASSFSGGAGEMSDMYAHSFDSVGFQGYGHEYGPNVSQGMLAQQQYALDGLHMPMGHPYSGWDMQQQQIEAEDGALVKREPRWEQTYGPI